jgi:tRNA threonylcarbamoyladenosine biosynthesis protein TsaE
MAEYAGRLPLFHIDLYRLQTAEEAMGGGLIDERQASGVTLVEWPDRLATALPGERLDIRIEGGGDEPRTITVRPADVGHARYLDVIP